MRVVRGLVAAAIFASFGAVSSQAAIKSIDPAFQGGFATSIIFDERAARGAADGRGDARNALGAPDGKFFEIGLGSFVDLTFGCDFNAKARVIEVTRGDVGAWPESIDLLASANGTDFTLIGSISNASAQGPLGASVFFSGGPFTVLRLQDTSLADGLTTGGFDIDAVQVNPVPAPAAGGLLAIGLAGLGWLSRRRKA